MVECVHHWKFPPPQGAISLGVCSLCGATQVAANYIEDLTNRKYFKKNLPKAKKESPPVNEVCTGGPSHGE